MRWPLWLGVLAAGAGCVHAEPTLPRYPTFAAALPRGSASAVPYLPARSQGRVVLVTFIATWCFPCLAELATVEKLERDYGPQGLDNVLVGMDLEGRRVLEPFAANYALPYPLVVADDALRKGQTPFGQVGELPTRVLFGRDGQVIAAWSGSRSWDVLAKAVEAALAERH